MRILLLAVSCLLATGCRKAVAPAEQQARATLLRRDVVLTIEAEVPAIAPGATELVVWIPVPRDEPAQVLKQMTPDPASRGVVVVDRTHRNPAIRVLFPAPGASASVKVSFLVSRLEYRSDGPGGQDDDATARAAFDHAIATVTSSGDCAVAHESFLRDLLAHGIEARLRSGVAVPNAGPDGRLAGEVTARCWAEYRSNTRGWVPVDLSMRRFGALDPDRIGLSMGHGLVFEGQTGPPLDAFASPYAELDGTPIQVLTKATWSERK